MEEFNPIDVYPEKQPALGDISNQLGKRGNSLISGNSGDKIVDDKENSSQFTKRVCQGVGNIVNEKCMIESFGNKNEKDKSASFSSGLCNETHSLQENVTSTISKASTEVKASENVVFRNKNEKDKSASFSSGPCNEIHSLQVNVTSANSKPSPEVKESENVVIRIENEKDKSACFSSGSCYEIHSLPGNVTPAISKASPEVKESENVVTGNEKEKDKSASFSSGPCNEIHSLQGNLTSAISKVSPEVKESENVVIGNENEKDKSASFSSVPDNEIYSLPESVISAFPKASPEVKESENVATSVHISRDDIDIDNFVEVEEATGDSCTSGTLSPIATGTSDGIKENCDKDEEQDPLHVVDICSQTGESVTEICEKDNEGIPVGNFTTGKHGMMEFSVGHESHVPGSFKLEKCKGLMSGSCSNSSSGTDLLKPCSCSFCVQAAYIWSDLHYQDIKGRLAALKKSQKEASIMREKHSRNKGIDKQIQGNHHNASKLESDLTSQWKSLFSHMEDIFEREGRQLETSLQPLKDLRDNCKSDLEKGNGRHNDDQ